MHQLPCYLCFSERSEYGPCMNICLFPVDAVFKKHPGLVDITLATTIYKHNLHTLLADMQIQKLSHDKWRRNYWTLCYLCLRYDIRFTVYLFTNSPHQSKGNLTGLISSISFAALIFSARCSGPQTETELAALRKSNIPALDSACK